jgi:hypothetical protein
MRIHYTVCPAAKAAVGVALSSDGAGNTPARLQVEHAIEPKAAGLWSLRCGAGRHAGEEVWWDPPTGCSGLSSKSVGAGPPPGRRSG